jgi:hypothetical protein
VRVYDFSGAAKLIPRPKKRPGRTIAERIAGWSDVSSTFLAGEATSTGVKRDGRGEAGERKEGGEEQQE